MNDSQRIALITGASTGIGLATAKRLLEGGVFVILTARVSSLSRFDRIDFLRDPSRFWIRPLDVTNALERRELTDEIDKKLGHLDILVNNAGVVYRTPLEYAQDFECKDQMSVNFHAPLELAKVCLPLMRRKGHGHIVNISSAAGFSAVPTMGLYAASKHALEGASEALHYELEPCNIHVTLVQPGFISAPNFHAQSPVVSKLINQALKMTTSSPEEVANVVWKVIENPRPPLRVQVTLDAQVLTYLKRFLPEAVFERLISYCLATVRNQSSLLSGSRA